MGFLFVLFVIIASAFAEEPCDLVWSDTPCNRWSACPVFDEKAVLESVEYVVPCLRFSFENPYIPYDLASLQKTYSPIVTTEKEKPIFPSLNKEKSTRAFPETTSVFPISDAIKETSTRMEKKESKKKSSKTVLMNDSFATVTPPVVLLNESQTEKQNSSNVTLPVFFRPSRTTETPSTGERFNEVDERPLGTIVGAVLGVLLTVIKIR